MRPGDHNGRGFFGWLRARIQEKQTQNPLAEYGTTKARRQGAQIPGIFISHSSADNAFVRRVAEDLSRDLAPGDVWYDISGAVHGGEVWWDRIVAELTRREIFLLVISPESMKSLWVADELRLAWKQKNGTQGKRIIPIVARDAVVPEYVSLLQAIRFHRQSYRSAFDQLLRAIQDVAQSDELAPMRAVSASGPPADDDKLPLPDHFVGRTTELAWVKTRLRKGGATAIVALEGLGGIGKTALAAIAVRELRWEGRFSRGLLVVVANEEHDPVKILREIVSRFQPDVPLDEELTPDEVSQLVEAKLAGLDALVVLDNVEPALDVTAVVAPLRKGRVSVLVTSRHELPSSAIPRDGMQRLGLLSKEEAFTLFAQVYKGSNLAAISRAEQQQIYRIVSSLGRHTLAVRLAGKSAADPSHSLSHLAQEYESHPLNVSAPDAAETVKVILGRSIDLLSDMQQRLFAACAAFGSIEFGRQGLERIVTALALPRDEDHISVLTSRALLEAQVNDLMPEQSDRDRLRLHPLMYEFALERFLDPTGPFERGVRDVVSRELASWYVEYCTSIEQDLALGADADVTIQDGLAAAGRLGA
jgi:hypothetical protein